MILQTGISLSTTQLKEIFTIIFAPPPPPPASRGGGWEGSPSLVPSLPLPEDLHLPGADNPLLVFVDLPCLSPLNNVWCYTCF